MRISVITPPAVEPITLAEAKLHCRVDLDNDDTLIERLIVAARERVEFAKKRALITQTIELRLDDWPCGRVIPIPRPPLQSVESIVYLDPAGDEQTLDPATYDVSPGTVGRVVLKDGASWPTIGGRPDAVRITYVAGYGDAPDHVPASTRAWLLLRVALAYKHREPVVQLAANEVPFLDQLLSGEDWGHYG